MKHLHTNHGINQILQTRIIQNHYNHTNLLFKMKNMNNPTKMIILHNTMKNTAIPNVEDVGVVIRVIIDAMR